VVVEVVLALVLAVVVLVVTARLFPVKILGVGCLEKMLLQLPQVHTQSLWGQAVTGVLALSQAAQEQTAQIHRR
jgi:hypothetical protein